MINIRTSAMPPKYIIPVIFAALIILGLWLLSRPADPVDQQTGMAPATSVASNRQSGRSGPKNFFNDGSAGDGAGTKWTGGTAASSPASSRQEDLIRRKAIALRPSLQPLIDRAQLLSGFLPPLELREAARRFEVDDLIPALMAVQEMEPGPKRRLVELALIHQWGRTDPLGALEYADGVSEVKYQHDVRRQIIAGWSEVEPAQALAFIEQHENFDRDGGMTRKIFRGVSSGDTDTGLQFLENLDYEKYVHQIRNTLYRMYENNPSRLKEWTLSLEEGQLRTNAMKRMLGQWARYDPQGAKIWMEQSFDTDHLNAAHDIFGRNWAQSDPLSAADWANGFDDQEKSERILSLVMKVWLRYDPAGAAAWIERQEPSKKLDKSIRSYAYSNMHRNPGYAVKWAESISDEQQRKSLIENLSRNWLEKEPDAATLYVQRSTELDEVQKNRLLEQWQKK